MEQIIDSLSFKEQNEIFNSVKAMTDDQNIQGFFKDEIHPAYKTYSDVLRYHHYGSFIKCMTRLYDYNLRQTIYEHAKVGSFEDVITAAGDSAYRFSFPKNIIACLSQRFEGQKSFIHSAINHITKEQLREFIEKLPIEYRLHYLALVDEENQSVNDLLRHRGVNLEDITFELTEQSPFQLENDQYVFKKAAKESAETLFYGSLWHSIPKKSVRSNEITPDNKSLNKTCI
jgi:hypothetical protein